MAQRIIVCKITDCSIHTLGSTVKFNRRLDRVWHYVPGRQPAKGSKQAFFPNVYSLMDVVEILSELTTINPSVIKFDPDISEVPVTVTKYFRLMGMTIKRGNRQSQYPRNAKTLRGGIQRRVALTSAFLSKVRPNVSR